MEAFIAQIEWTPVLVSTVVAFMVGWAWYSPMLFVKRWIEGLGQPPRGYPMWMPMVTQISSTFLFAIVMNFAVNTGAVAMVALFTIILAGFIKANGLYTGKSVYSIGVETMYIFVMAVVLWAVNIII